MQQRQIYEFARQGNRPARSGRSFCNGCRPCCPYPMAGYSSFNKKPAGITVEQICADVKAGKLKPVYYLMGEESYYIDYVENFIVNTLLTPEERDFNLITFFGADADVDNIITAAKAYPMGGEHTVIVVKEAQALKGIARLEYYFKQVQPSTVLIFCHKNGVLDRRTKLATLIGKEGVLFESKKLKDNQLPTFVRNYMKGKGVAIEPGAAEMVAEYIGVDLNRITSELDKLVIALPTGEKTVTAKLVRQQTGMSKNFSIFELLDAIGTKNVLRANQIVKYFDNNPRENPIQRTLPALFRYFSNLMLAYYAPEKTEAGIASWLGMTPWLVKCNVLPPMRHYSGVKTMKILSEIRRTDARSKGSEGSHTENGDLMKELLFFILH